MPSLSTAIGIDLAVIVFCGLLALKVARSLLHPAWMILLCHCYIVTVRLFQLRSGLPPMAYSFQWPVGIEEVIRAAMASDLALLAMALGWIVTRYWGEWRKVARRDPSVLVTKSRVQIAAALAITLSFLAILYVGPAGLRDQRLVAGTTASSGYLMAAASWTGWGFCLLHFYYGFPPLLLGVTVSMLFISMMFSAFRGVVIIPLVFLLLLYIVRRQKKGFPMRLVMSAPLLWLIWLPMKPVFYALQQGDPAPIALAKGIDTAFGNFGRENGSGIDFQFLDMIGSTMTLEDIHGQHFWGASIAPILVSPVPRLFWPEKPNLNQYQEELDIPSRPMAKFNMTAGLIGESYADFGWAGVIAVPFLISVGFTLAYLRLAGTSALSPGCLLYLIYLSTFMQLYRDGLIAAVWFPFVHCAPVGWLAVSIWLFPPRKRYAREKSDAVRQHSTMLTQRG